MEAGVPRSLTGGVHLCECRWRIARPGELPQQSPQTSRGGVGTSQADLPGAPTHYGNTGTESGLSEGYSIPPAALTSGHHRERVHAGASRERATNGRNGLCDAHRNEDAAANYVGL